MNSSKPMVTQMVLVKNLLVTKQNMNEVNKPVGRRADNWSGRRCKTMESDSKQNVFYENVGLSVRTF